MLATMDSTKPRSEPVPWKRLFATPAVWALLVNHFCSNWGMYVLLAWLPSYFKSAQGLPLEYAGLYAAAPWLIMFVMVNVVGWLADRLVRRGVDLTFVRKLMQCIGLFGSAAFLILACYTGSSLGALLLLCGSLGALAFTWSGYASNYLDIAPRYADVLISITNTAGTIPGIVGVALTGWLIDATGSYTSVFLLAAAINVVGGLVWIAFATARRILE